MSDHKICNPNDCSDNLIIETSDTNIYWSSISCYKALNNIAHSEFLSYGTMNIDMSVFVTCYTVYQNAKSDFWVGPDLVLWLGSELGLG